MQFDRGYLSPYFVTQLRQNDCRTGEDRSILCLHEKKLSSLQPMVYPLLEQVSSRKNTADHLGDVKEESAGNFGC